jgi:hypothetical protein
MIPVISRGLMSLRGTLGHIQYTPFEPTGQYRPFPPGLGLSVLPAGYSAFGLMMRSTSSWFIRKNFKPSRCALR